MSIFEDLFTKKHDQPMTLKEIEAEFGSHYLSSALAGEHIDATLEEVSWQSLISTQEGRRVGGCAPASLITAFGPGL